MLEVEREANLLASVVVAAALRQRFEACRHRPREARRVGVAQCGVRERNPQVRGVRLPRVGQQRQHFGVPAAIEQGSPTVLINWLSSTFLQLVLLPIIIVGQNVISAAQDARAEADHATLTALHQLATQQLGILKGQTEVLDLLKSKFRPG